MAASMTAPPHTPTTATFFPPSSPGPELHTPPESVRKYSDELRRAMAAGYRNAVKDLTRDRPLAGRHGDVEYGYDEDPFDVRARTIASLHATPTKRAPLALPAFALPPLPPLPALPALSPFPSFRSYSASPTKQGEHDWACARADADADPFASLAPAQAHPSLTRDASDVSADIFPGLAQFRRASRLALSPYAPSAAATMSRCNTTDSATWSEASFEAVGPEDYDSMYGGPHSTADAAAVFGQPGPVDYAQSPLAQAWTPAPCIDRFGRLSIAPAATDATATSTVRPSSVPRRPSLLRPHPARTASRSRPCPYPYPYAERGREPSAESEAERAGAGAHDGRTLSENMILTAGMMSQRGRQARGSLV
ncbi:hypothetical protein Q5752_006627 [Cryptotrichosporon argae]